MTVASNRLKLLAILALFILPLLLAVLMFKGKLPLLSGDTVNQGKLVQPPVALDWGAAKGSKDNPNDRADLLGNWVILLPLADSCGQECVRKATGLRQLHRASGREQHRIRIVLLAESVPGDRTRQEYAAIYDQFTWLSDPGHELLRQLQQVAKQTRLEPDTVTSYLVDPLGNIMMAYDMADSETRMSKDLKRLLKWSKQDQG